VRGKKWDGKSGKQVVLPPHDVAVHAPRAAARVVAQMIQAIKGASS